MKIEEFIGLYSSEYMDVFYPEIKIEAPKKSTISKISDFLFEPRYEVNNLNFKLVMS